MRAGRRPPAVRSARPRPGGLHGSRSRYARRGRLGRQRVLLVAVALLALRPRAAGGRSRRGGPAPTGAAAGQGDPGGRRRHDRGADRPPAARTSATSASTRRRRSSRGRRCSASGRGRRASTTGCSRGGGCGWSSASSAATSTGACSPTSTSGDCFVNAELVRRGLARTLTIPPNDRYAPLFRSLEQAAAAPGAGSGAPAEAARGPGALSAERVLFATFTYAIAHAALVASAAALVRR